MTSLFNAKLRPTYQYISTANNNIYNNNDTNITDNINNDESELNGLIYNDNWIGKTIEDLYTKGDNNSSMDFKQIPSKNDKIYEDCKVKLIYPSNLLNNINKQYYRHQILYLYASVLQVKKVL